MDGWIWLPVVLAVALVVALVVFFVRRDRRRAQLRQRFGPEYDRAVRDAPDRRTAELHLLEVSRHRDELEVHDLPGGAAAAYRRRWADVQSAFVDDPTRAVSDADDLVAAVLDDRGYAAGSFDDRVALVATDHPDIVEDYRVAHEAHGRRSAGADTEQLRTALLRYRSVLTALTRPGTPPARVEPAPPAQ